MKKKLTFEESLEQLEDIIAQMENGETTLDKSLENYKNGIELITNCNKILEEAKLKIQTVDMTENNNVNEE